MSLRDKLRKADWLSEMQMALAVVAAAVAVAVGAATWSAVAGRSVVTRVRAEAVTGVAGSSAGLTGGARIAPESVVEVTVADPSTRQAVANALTALPGLLVVLAMLGTLAWIVRAARRADPFTGGTVRRLRMLAAGVMIGGVAAGLVETVAEVDLVSSVTAGSFSAAWTFPGHWLLLGFSFLAVAEVVNRGAAMRSELETVI